VQDVTCVAKTLFAVETINVCQFLTALAPVVFALDAHQFLDAPQFLDEEVFRKPVDARVWNYELVPTDGAGGRLSRKNSFAVSVDAS
jgi:hypothetical protein